MKSLVKTPLAVLVLGVAALSTTAQAEELKVMTSGGFTAAYKALGPEYAAASGDTLNTILGPSMGKAPEAIPNRLDRGEHADVVIMVGYALDELIKQGKVDPASRVELADSRIGMVVRQGAAKPAITTDAELKAAAGDKPVKVDALGQVRATRFHLALFVHNLCSAAPCFRLRTIATYCVCSAACGWRATRPDQGKGGAVGIWPRADHGRLRCFRARRHR